MADRRNELYHQSQMNSQYGMGQGQPPRYPNQQMMGPGGMMRPMNQSQMMAAQANQMMSRPPPPDYRSSAMLQQQQPMMAQPMPQAMGHMSQGMGQMPYQNMRPGIRPGMPAGAMTAMGGNQMMGGISQQNLPPNMPNLKAGMVPTTGGTMGSSISMASSMGAGTMTVTSMPGGGTMTNTMVQGGTNNPGSMAMIPGRGQMTRGSMMQNTRAPSVNMGMQPMGMGTQMPASRPDWQMVMSQGNRPMMIPAGMRPAYQQGQQG